MNIMAEFPHHLWERNKTRIHGVCNLLDIYLLLGTNEVNAEVVVVCQ